jgi:electron transfer flavoprotein alpha subunit
VNLDASAPIAKRANLTIIGDAQETIAALTDAAAAARNARATPGSLTTSGSSASSAAKLEGALA